MNETQDEAWRDGAARVPEGAIAEIYEATNDGRPTGWPEFYDRTGEVWAQTNVRHDGDVVMMPGSGWVPMLRRDVQAEWGPLVSREGYSEYLQAQNRRAALRYEGSTEARLARVERLAEDARDKGNSSVDIFELLDALGLEG